MAGLDRTYDQAMERIADQGHEAETLAKQILTWIIHSKRPLSTLELRHALAVEKSSTALDTDFLPSPKLMLSLCAGLVTFDETSSVIRLVHYTTQEYFERTQKRWFPEAEFDITMSCVTYLLFDSFKSGLCPTDAEFEQRLQSNPLYEYAAHNWGNHARKASTSYEGVTEFLESKVHVEASSQAMMAMKRYSSHTNYSQEVPSNTTGLHLAACFGLKEAVSALLELNHDPNLKDTYSRTPLWWASREGHEAVVELLLASRNVDPTIRDNKGRTPLSWAARYGHVRVVKLLLASDKVDPNVKDNFYGQTPLSWAAENGQEVVIRLLLESERVDPNAKDNYFGRVPLSWAAAEGHEAVVRLLLASERVDRNTIDNKGRTPLSWAIEKGHKALVKLLLKNGAGRNAEDELCWAIRTGPGAFVKLLLENGADPNAKDRDGQTSLSWATEKRDEAILRVLIENGANPNSADKDGRTLLSHAAEKGHEAIVRLLIENGADPNIIDKDGRTPLSRADEKEHGDNVKKLLESGADPNYQPFSYDFASYRPPVPYVGKSGDPPSFQGLDC
jgi:ankyrin repeat protein